MGLNVVGELAGAGCVMGIDNDALDIEYTTAHGIHVHARCNDVISMINDSTELARAGEHAQRMTIDMSRKAKAVGFTRNGVGVCAVKYDAVMSMTPAEVAVVTASDASI